MILPAAYSMPFLIILLLWPVMAIFAQPSPSSKCTSKCGNVTIPFPFGIEESCAMDGFFKVDCNSSKPYLREINLEVLDLSIDGTMRVSYSVYNTCDPTQNLATANLKTSPFIFSQTKNRILGVGCGNYSLLSNDDSVIAQCLTTTCGRSGNSSSYCQSTIGSPLKGFAPFIETSPDDQECHYAALVEEGFLEQNLKNPQDLRRLTHVPVVLEWSVLARYFDFFARNKSKTYESTSTCERSACSCFSSDSPTVRCNCLRGFQGNPYLLDGCQDIDECATNTTICGSQNCENFIGGYNCYSSARSKSEESKVNMIILGLSTSFGTLFLLIGAWWLYVVIKRRKEIKLKENNFKRNGGLLLQQQLTTSFSGSVDRGKMFNSKELEKSTDHFNENRILGQGGQGTVYKGMLADGRIVAVKKSKIVDQVKLQEFINEVVILSQINHKNVVKLLGCCLETDVPLLIYEFVPNGTLFQYIQEQNEDPPFTWDMRLRIATEIAGALCYLHSAASLPIYHRDIKSSNILLDDKYRAKVADFGTSKSVPVDHTHVTTRVQGTFGYFDPEYFQSNQFTDKSDVYSYGVVLVELLTGQKPIFSTITEQGRSLASYFINSMEEDNLYEILDAQVKLGKEEEIMAMANLAMRCLNLHGKQRPTMKEVAMELEGVRAPKRNSNVQVQHNYETFKYEGLEVTELWDGTTSTYSTFDSVSASVDADPLLT
ncbi:hypothetical protein ACOSP7_004064 [Xanthoceras sorbifolium]